jgi:hypothetical protein
VFGSLSLPFSAVAAGVARMFGASPEQAVDIGGELGGTFLLSYPGELGVGRQTGLSVVRSETAMARTAEPWKYANRSELTYRTADEVNAEFPAHYRPPYEPGTRVVEYTTKMEDQFVRVHGEDNQARQWMMRREAIEGLTAEEISRKYSLPEVPRYVSDVTVPAGEHIRVGRTAENYGGGSGAMQYQWLGRVPENAFTNRRELPRSR